MRSDERHDPRAGFTLLELVLAISLFALIVVNVLADRERSIRIAGEARILQTVRYLAQSKIDEIRHDPDPYGESEGGDFSDLNTDWQDFSAFTWELEVRRLVAVGSGDAADADFLFPEDETEDAVTGQDGNALDPRYVRRLTLTVRYEPDGILRPDLSIKIVTFIPDSEEENP